ncbi:MAG: delta-aminolevulinic acid dehydratase [Ruminococcaceae bacterium]|nr:delta-aminolevulinic acid dehydratase [Oscillospiraceae bacterium]
MDNAKIKNILILVIGGTGNEPEALRQSLEYFGYFVAIKYIGRPNDLTSVLKGDLPFDADCIILSCHGEDGEIIMPVLGEEVYEPDEPKGNITASDIDKYLKLKDKLILNLGCTTGEKDLAKAFSKKNTYIASDDYIEGSAALYFAVSLFYEMSKGTDLDKAYKTSKETDSETKLFKIFR